MDISSDGSQLANATDGGVVEIWDTATGMVLHQLRPPAAEDDEGGVVSFSDVAFSPKADSVAACAGGRVFVWGLASEQERSLLEVDDHLDALAWMPDGRTIVTGGAKKELLVWDLTTGEITLRLQGHSAEITGIAATNKLLLSTGRDGRLLSFSARDFAASKFTGTGDSAFEQVAVSPSGKLAAAGTRGGKVVLWDLKRKRISKTINVSESPIADIAFSSSGRSFVALAGGELQVFSVKGARLKRLQSPGAVAAAFPGILFAGGEGLETWDVESGTNLLEEVGHQGPVRAVAFANSGKFVASGGDGDPVKIWEAATGHELQSLAGHRGVLALASSEDGTHVVAGGRSRDVHVWNVLTGVERARLSGHTGLITAVSFSPVGQRVASGGSDHVVRIWNLDTGMVEQAFTGDGGHVRSMTFSPTGRLLAATLHRGWFADNAESVVVWHVGNGSRQYRIKLTAAALDIAFSPDGERLAIAGADGAIRIYNSSTAKEIQVLSGHVGPVRALDWDGRTDQIASGGSDKTVRIWSAKTGRELKKLEGHVSAVYALSFGPNGESLATASADSTVLVWALVPP
jgi:WD40 repeat protein